MKMQLYRQTDNKWINDRLGNSNYTIGGSGCLVTALSNILLLNGNPNLNPKIVNQILTTNNGFTDDGLLIWSVFDRIFNCSSIPNLKDQPNFNQQSAVYYVVKIKNHFINLLYTINNYYLCFDVFGGNLIAYTAENIGRVIQVKFNKKKEKIWRKKEK